MEEIIFQFWLLILGILAFYSLWRRNALFLFIVGLGIIAFGWSLTFDGLNVVTGFNQTTDAYTYTTITPQNDQLLSIIAVVSLPLGLAMALFALSILLSQFTDGSSRVRN